jgi:uncharacterized FlaG/YvyC family protein
VNVSLDPTANTSSQQASSNASATSNAQTATQQESSVRVAKSAETPATSIDLTTVSKAQSSTQPTGEIPQANVTFRRDDAGQVYYVLTDSESGKEIREVPPAEIRKVGEGIAEYLKQEAAKGSSAPHVKVKA